VIHGFEDFDRRLAALREGTRALQVAEAREVAERLQERLRETAAETRRAEGEALLAAAVRGTTLAAGGSEDPAFAELMRNPGAALDRANAAQRDGS